MISSVSKEEVISVRVNSHRITRSKYYGVITKRMNFNYPVAKTGESVEPNDNNLELNAISHTFSKIDSNLAPVVQTLDNAIHRINRYPVDKC